ncbi:MAG: OprO/OprP family phosphate-selective porin [Acidobacteriota bacterium]
MLCRTFGSRCLLGALTVLAPLAATAAEHENSLDVFYHHGLHFETADQSFQLTLGGRIQSDWAFFDKNNLPPGLDTFDDGTEFRRARLFLSGVIYGNVEFKAQYDFAGGDAVFKDVYIGLLDVNGLDHLRFGHQKEPFSIEALTSSKYITFMERALPDVFAPERNTGVRVQSAILDGRVTWSAGLFTEADDFGNNDDLDGGPNLTGRVTWLPLYQDGGRRLVHVGLSVTQKGVTDGVLQFAQRPEAHLAARFADTGSFPADTAFIYTTEVAWVRERLSLQGEFTQVDVDSRTANDPSFSGFYAQASFFLTRGDHRAYNTSVGAFDRVTPRKNYGSGGGGALELAARYSMIDLTDEVISGGELDDFTLGMNWYLNPSTRFSANYVRSELTERDPSLDNDEFQAFMVRFQVDF